MVPLAMSTPLEMKTRSVNNLKDDLLTWYQVALLWMIVVLRLDALRTSRESNTSLPPWHVRFNGTPLYRDESLTKLRMSQVCISKKQDKVVKCLPLVYILL